MPGQDDDMERYKRGNYRARNRDASWVVPENARSRSQRRASRASADPDPFAPKGSGGSEPSSEYSRQAASERYRRMQRHSSFGGKLERPRSGAAAFVLDNRRRIVLITLAVVLIAFLVAAVAWYNAVSQAMKPSEDVSAATGSTGIGQPYYVLLMGSDSRKGKSDVARADSIMLCRVDESKKQVTMISLPRDLRVEIEGYGKGKLNSALTRGGYSGAIKAVSELAGVPIQYYATIYFGGFKRLVNDLGGVDVEVPKGTYYNGVSVPAGKSSHINGKQALVLARCRHGKPADQGAYRAGDYQRTKNQRNLMKAIVKKILQQPVWAVPGQVYTVAKCIETNMPAWKMAKVAVAMRGMDADGMYSATAPAYGQYIGGVSYQILYQDKWTAMMARVEEGEDPNG